MKYLKLALFAIPAALAMLACVTLSGCNNGPTPNPNPTPMPDPKVVSLIKTGVSTAVSMGFVAIPDQAEATQIATATKKAVETSVLPILNGDDAGIVAGLQQILALKAFDDPSLAKAKAILEAALPLLEVYLPPDVLSGQTNKIPADVKAYLIAFFTGVDQGCTNYLPPTANTPKLNNGIDFHHLHDILVASATKGPATAK